MSRRVAFLVSVLAVAMALGAGSPAHAQLNFTGNWGPIMHEDAIERVAGPELGDYAGLPVNDAMRRRAYSWDASLLTLPEHQCKPPSLDIWTPGSRQHAHPADSRQSDRVSRRLPNTHPLDGAGTHDLDGWTAASARVRASYLAGILYRGVGG